MNAKQIFLHKCRMFNPVKKEYCGYLQPAEIKLLMSAGCREYLSGFDQKERYRENLKQLQDEIKRGVCNSRWWYFVLPKGFLSD